MEEITISLPTSLSNGRNEVEPDEIERALTGLFDYRERSEFESEIPACVRQFCSSLKLNKAMLI